MLRRRLPVALLLVLVACSSQSVSGSPSPGTPSAPGQSGSVPGGSGTPTAPPTTSGSLQRVARFAGAPTGLAVGSDGSIYVSHSLGASPYGPQVVVRYQPSSGAVTQSRSLPGGQAVFGQGRLVVAGDSVWVLGGAVSTGGGSLYRLDASTLKLLGSPHVPARPTAIAATASGPWVSAGNGVYLFDAATGALAASVTLPATITHLASDPSGALLYVTTTGPVGAHGGLPLLELDAGTGNVLRSIPDVAVADLNGASGLAATDQGVWVTIPTGTMAQYSFYRAGDLHLTTTGRRGGSNALQATIAGAALWLVDGAATVRCADPATGAVLARLSVPKGMHPAAPFVTAPAGVFAGIYGGLGLITPPAACG